MLNSVSAIWYFSSHLGIGLHDDDDDMQEIGTFQFSSHCSRWQDTCAPLVNQLLLTLSRSHAPLVHPLVQQLRTLRKGGVSYTVAERGDRIS